MVQILKLAAIEVAEEMLRTSTDKINVSRISVLTGITRPEVKRIYKEGRAPSVRTEASLHARVMNCWEQDAAYATKGRRPKVLAEDEFRQLVSTVVKHVNPGTVLFEMQRSGAVERTARGLRLSDPYVGGVDQEKSRVELLADDLETFFAAVEDNLQHQEEPRNLHLRTEYDNISATDLQKIREWFLREGRALHRKARGYLSTLDLDLKSRSDDKRRSAGGHQVVLSSFSFTSRPADE